jgi:hypothetical protein
MMEAAWTSETSVDIYLATRQYIPEDSELHARRRENLKSHTAIAFLNSVNQLIFVMVKYSVLFEVRTEFLNII